MLAASPMRAADRPEASSLLTPQAPAGKVSVVRVDRRTGKLVRSIYGGDAPAQVKIAPPPARIQKMVEQSSRAHNVDPLLVQSVIQVESNYNHYAVSAKGAEGLMQLMPGTARALGVSNSFDPAQNIEAGVKYLKYLQGLYQDDRLALAAYNAGPKAVEKHKSIPPYAETQDYVNQVGSRYRAAKQNEAANTAEQAAPLAPEAETVAPEQHPKLEQSTDDHGRLVLRTVQQ
jgi:soluble lytic murein transglycosylase-like protein